VLLVVLRDYGLTQVSQRFSLELFSRSLVLVLTFRSVVHFELLICLSSFGLLQ
jgi:hypothetical protein